MSQNLETLKSELLADGVIDAQEVAKLKELLYADGIIDRAEADFLFDLNDAVTGNDNAPEWADFFVQAIADHVLSDESSPNVIDEDEAAYLIHKIQGDGQVDAIERKLLKAIKERATEVHASLGDFIQSNL